MRSPTRTRHTHLRGARSILDRSDSPLCAGGLVCVRAIAGAFNLPRGPPCREKWQLIPEDTDVLLTHGPPLGHGDLCSSGMRAGCIDLLHEVQTRVRPAVHAFGHIHEGAGVTTDGATIYVNASTCNLQYRPINPAVVLDILPPDSACGRARAQVVGMPSTSGQSA